MLAVVRGRAAAIFADGPAPAVQAFAPARRVIGSAEHAPRGLVAPARVREEVTLGRRARVLIDLAPLRRPRDLRLLVFGELVSVLGSQLTTVAVPYQVYQLTHSSLDVGLVSARLLPGFRQQRTPPVHDEAASP